MIDIRFDEENAPELYQQFLELAELNPRHFSLVVAAAAYSWALFSKPLVITSIYRDHQGSVHRLWRGTDVRIYHGSRSVPTGYEGLYPDEAEEVAYTLNKTFEYVKVDGTKSNVVTLHGTGMNYHMHLQTPVGSRWRA